jgi:hypothetical protein
MELNHTCSFLQLLGAYDEWIGFRALSVPQRKALSPQDFYSVYLSKHNVTVSSFT